MSEVVFSIYDPTRGPKPVFTTIDDEQARKIAFKSQLTVDMKEVVTDEGTEAVLPFPDLKKTGYVYMFNLTAESGNTPDTVLASITYLIDTENQMELYKNASLLKFEAKELIKMIKNTLKVSNKVKLVKEIQKKLINWGQSLEDTSIQIEEEYVKRRITIKKSSTEPSVPVLFDLINKRDDLVILITSLLKNDPVIIKSTTKSLEDIVVASLESFLPHKTPKKMLAEEYIKPKEADIIILRDESLISAYKGYTILDIDKKKVISETDVSLFVKDLIRNIKGKKHEEAIKIIQNKIAWLLDKVSQLTEVFIADENKKRQAKEKRKKAIKKLSEEAPEAFNIIKEICASVNPAIKDMMIEEVDKYQIKALDSFMHGW